MRMKFYFIILLGLFFSSKGFSQDPEKNNKVFSLGLNYGKSTQNEFPFGNPNYVYDNEFFKIQINKALIQKKISLELLIEPSFYNVEHQLLNKFFIPPEEGTDYVEQRERFTQKRSFEEYALNIGILIRYPIFNHFSTYALGSLGPMISTGDTERLKKGFAFSDILGFGFSYQQGRLVFDLRATIRHNSNANLYLPNNGHNSVGIESGVSYQFR